ncbi:MAG: hypothetical protein EOO63_00995 [Hymenobacter sp.]|nr:MAG: hypothetical protein EOO63_00995 [Hymenobacter sp.]
MKVFLPLVPLLVCLAACQSTPATPAATADAAPTLPKQEQTNLASAKPAGQPEHIEWSMLTVNGQPHQELTTALLKRQLGQPDSIAKGAVECGSMLESLNKLDGAEGDFWYYGRTAYEVSGTQAILASFDVTTGKFEGKLGSLLLNQHTTLEDVRRIFPVSAKQADVPATGRPGHVMSLPFYFKGVPEDASLNLIFKNGRLQEVEFFTPC